MTANISAVRAATKRLYKYQYQSILKSADATTAIQSGLRLCHAGYRYQPSVARSRPTEFQRQCVPSLAWRHAMQHQAYITENWGAPEASETTIKMSENDKK